MRQKRLTILLAVVLSLACGLPQLPGSTNEASPAPTLEIAQFTTPTPTALPTETPTLTPTSADTPTPEATATSVATPSPTLQIQETDETTPVAEDEIEVEISEETPPLEATVEPTEPPPAPPEPPTATPATLSGRIAFPIDDGGGHYDVWAIELPAGEPFLIQKGARQPNFSVDGRLLINNQDSAFGENIGMLDRNYAWLGLVSEAPEDGFPFWQPDGSRYVYSNPKFLLDPSTKEPLPHVFIPCSLRRPSVEDDLKCRDIGTGGKVSSGEYPVWTDDDRIAFFYFAADDGIYVVGGASTLWEAGGVGTPQLLVKGNGRPSDTQGFQVFFSAGDIDQNWEAYAIDLDGSNLINLSNSPFFQDGLPTVSPDGKWVAFVSDRDGLWGIWVVSRTGGEPSKVVDLSKINTNPSSWGTGDREWTRERLSWGP